MLAAGIALPATAENLVVRGIVMAAVPVFVVSYLASDKLVPEHQSTEASTWVNTANNLGAAAGSTTAAFLVAQSSSAMAKPLLR